MPDYKDLGKLLKSYRAQAGIQKQERWFMEMVMQKGQRSPELLGWFWEAMLQLEGKAGSAAPLKTGFLCRVSAGTFWTLVCWGNY